MIDVMYNMLIVFIHNFKFTLKIECFFRNNASNISHNSCHYRQFLMSFYVCIQWLRVAIVMCLTSDISSLDSSCLFTEANRIQHGTSYIWSDRICDIQVYSTEFSLFRTRIRIIIWKFLDNLTWTALKKSSTCHLILPKSQFAMSINNRYFAA